MLFGAAGEPPPDHMATCVLGSNALRLLYLTEFMP